MQNQIIEKSQEKTLKFFGAFASSRKPPIIFVMSVLPFVGIYKFGCHLTNFRET
jgi:hypothetical protein